nr:MAG TPA: hypothetical protein [Caudoviricetes sp.]
MRFRRRKKTAYQGGCVGFVLFSGSAGREKVRIMRAIGSIFQ